jgi:hypothetical protein
VSGIAQSQPLTAAQQQQQQQQQQQEQQQQQRQALLEALARMVLPLA